MSNLRNKYICISDVALVEIHYFGVLLPSFSFFGWHRAT